MLYSIDSDILDDVRACREDYSLWNKDIAYTVIDVITSLRNLVKDQYNTTQMIKGKLYESNKLVEHWKANHKNMVDRSRVLIDRTDMPLERVKAFEYLGKMQEMESLVKEFIGILDIIEESDSGRQFRPNQISSCRVMDGIRMGEILAKWKELT
jgi:hypothetical protein